MEYNAVCESSDFVDEDIKLCQPCFAANKKVKSQAFCVNCGEFLCRHCSDYHTTLGMTKHHVLVTAEEGRNAPQGTAQDRCSFKCDIHKDKTVKYFCPSHSHLGCSVCVTNELERCRNLVHIPTVAADLEGLDEFKTFVQCLRNTKTAYKARIDDVSNHLKTILTDERQLNDAIIEFKREVNKALKKMKADLLEQAKKIKAEELTYLKHLSAQLEKSENEVKSLISKVDSLLGQGAKCDAYVVMQSETQKLTRLHEELEKTVRGKTYRRFAFHRNESILGAWKLGKLTTRAEPVSNNPSTTVASHVGLSKSVTPDSSVTMLGSYHQNVAGHFHRRGNRDEGATGTFRDFRH